VETENTAAIEKALKEQLRNLNFLNLLVEKALKEQLRNLNFLSLLVETD
jgi:hypothetical protein